MPPIAYSPHGKPLSTNISINTLPPHYIREKLKWIILIPEIDTI